MMGFVAKVSLLVTHMDHFGVFKCRISNSIGAQTVYVDIVPEGPPEVPYSVSIQDVQSSSVIISWLPGFHGGFDQTFTIEYRTKADEWLHVKITGSQHEYRFKKSIGGLQTGTIYFFRIKSVNERGTSDYSNCLNVTTKCIEAKPHSPTNSTAIAGGVSAGVVFFAAVGIVAHIFVRKRKAKSTDGRSHQIPAANADLRDNISSGVQHGGMVCEYYNINRDRYESLEYAHGHGHEYKVIGQRRLYEDLSYTNDSSHHYGTLGKVEEDQPVSNDGKMYENLRLSPLK